MSNEVLKPAGADQIYFIDEGAGGKKILEIDPLTPTAGRIISEGTGVTLKVFRDTTTGEILGSLD